MKTNILKSKNNNITIKQVKSDAFHSEKQSNRFLWNSSLNIVYLLAMFCPQF